ncbi:MAG TPA: DUF177 domain-containing protein [Clostridia bacterium]|nr:DUF177 domain-containing protein [Clostridia bacterium]
MNLDVRQANNHKGETIPFEFVIGPSDLDLRGEAHICSDIVVGGSYMYTGDDYIVSGCIKARLDLECDRCANDFTMDVSIPFEEEYTDETNGQHWERNVFTGKQINIKDLIEDNILLYLSGKILCSPQCKGICPKCGADLNKGDCSCGI